MIFHLRQLSTEISKKMVDKRKSLAKLYIEEEVKPITLEEGVKGEEYVYALIRVGIPMLSG